MISCRTSCTSSIPTGDQKTQPFSIFSKAWKRQIRISGSVATMTGMAHSGREWTGETGFIDGEMLARHLGPLQGPIYYIAGPPPMVAAMRQMLVGAGVDEDDIRSEEFAGY